MEWFSWTVAVILLISSVVSPWLVNKENNKHQLKLKNLDMYEQAKRKALQTFNEEAVNYKYSSGLGGSIPLRKAINNLYLFFNDIPNDITELLNKDFTDYDIKLNNIVQDLSKQISKE